MPIEAEEAGEDEDNDEGSEYESYTDDSEAEQATLHKPVFVSKYVTIYIIRLKMF